MSSVERAQASGMRLTAGRKLPEPVGRGRARYPHPGNAEDAGARPRRRCGRSCRNAHPVIPLIPRRRGRRGAAGNAGAFGAGTVHSGHMTAPEPDADRAITAIYGSEYRSLVRLAVVLVGDVAAAEEIVQDSFVAMRGAWRRLQDRDKALSYLRQSVVARRRVDRDRATTDCRTPGSRRPGSRRGPQ